MHKKDKHFKFIFSGTTVKMTVYTSPIHISPPLQHMPNTSMPANNGTLQLYQRWNIPNNFHGASFRLQVGRSYRRRQTILVLSAQQSNTLSLAGPYGIDILSARSSTTSSVEAYVGNLARQR
ncbi:hypothetical protein QCA50_007567 [Cerrena zonata]|uniref:Uncharacterized protein n=1 Tax=Cerrena zonata TaxID=2478898 RepID=A0AAW0GHC6_9APHY